jgi:quinol monooxygenase YgiN
MSVAIVINYTALTGKEDEAVRELESLISTVVERESDCLSIALLQDPDARAKILLYEIWTSREAYFGEHMTTPHIVAFRERAGEFFADAPTITAWNAVTEYSK